MYKGLSKKKEINVAFHQTTYVTKSPSENCNKLLSYRYSEYRYTNCVLAMAGIYY